MEISGGMMRNALVNDLRRPGFLFARGGSARVPRRGEQVAKGFRVPGRMAAVVIVEVNPCPLRGTFSDPFRPLPELFVRVVVAIPALRAVQAHVDLVRRTDEFVGKTRPAAGAEYDPGLLKGAVDLLVPPALVPELHGVAARRIELAYDRLQARLSVAVAWRELEEEAPIRSPRISAMIPKSRTSVFVPLNFLMWVMSSQTFTV